MDFRLYYSGKKPNWGIAFRNPTTDIKQVFQKQKPSTINIQFFKGQTYTFGIRQCFWKNCHEFMDTQVSNVNPVEELFINKLGFNTHNNGDCNITVIILHNTLNKTQNIQLRIIKIEI